MCACQIHSKSRLRHSAGAKGASGARGGARTIFLCIRRAHTRPSHNIEGRSLSCVYSKPAQTKRAFYYPQAKTKRATYYPQAQTKRARLITRGGPDEVRDSKRTTRLPAGPDAGAEGSVRGELVVGV